MCHTVNDAQEMPSVYNETVKYYILTQFVVTTTKEHTNYLQLISD